MPEATEKAINVLVTKKLVQKSRPYILNYFGREFLPKQFNRSERVCLAYDNLCKIDNQGLFLPIYVNELNKYARQLYPTDVTIEIETIIIDFSNFILNIALKRPDEFVVTRFIRTGISIHIVLAKNESDADIKRVTDAIGESFSNGIDTVYVIGSGSKTIVAEEITKRAYEEYAYMLEEPKIVQYIRSGKSTGGTSAVSYEITRNSYD